MTYHKYYVAAAAVCLVGAFLSFRSALAQERRAGAAEAKVRIWQSRYAEEASKALPTAETVRVRADGVKVRRDTLLLHLTDTVAIKQYIYSTDTLRIACEQCAKRLVAFKWTADSTIQSYQDALTRQKPKLLSRCGVFAGYGISGGQDHVARYGLTIAAGCRLLP